MALAPTPIAVWTTAIMVAPQKLTRNKIRFQNNDSTILYFVRQLSVTPNIPSPTNFEFSLAKEQSYETNSTAQFNCVSSWAWGSLALYETVGG